MRRETPAHLHSAGDAAGGERTRSWPGRWGLIGRAATTPRHIVVLIPLAVIGIIGGLVAVGSAGLWVFIPGLLQGALVTIEITVMGCVLAVLCALVAALAKLSPIAPLRWLASVYIEIFRGTSALVQLFWLFFVLPQFGITLPPIAVAVLALGLNVGAYGAEVVRGAIQAVPKGQWEASTALNLSRSQAMRRIILPQAVVAMIPPWGNLFIELLKATSLVSLITITDLTFRAQQMNQVTLQTTEIFTLVLGIYLCISLVITAGMRWLERRAAAGMGLGRPTR